MTLIVEDGTGVNGANAYVDVAFVTTYLTNRNRETENLWSTVGTAPQEGAIVQATDFIERRWGLRFLGQREFNDVSAARSTLTFTAQPVATDIVTIDATVFTFGTNVTIGADLATTIDNLVTAAANHVTVTVKAGPGDTLKAEAKLKGTPGNGIVTSTDVTGATWSSATLLGGGDVRVAQPLSFPRLRLFDREGFVVLGIPARLKQAVAEYAVRAVSTTITLMPDPTIDATGRAVVLKREKVGPIDVTTQYSEGGAISQLIRPYPAADRLLAEYVTGVGSGRVIRG